MHSSSDSLPEIENIWTFIAPSLKKNRKRTAWVCREGKNDKREIKYGELEKAALTTAAILRAEGIKAGDTIGVGAEWT